MVFLSVYAWNGFDGSSFIRFLGSFWAFWLLTLSHATLSECLSFPSHDRDG